MRTLNEPRHLLQQDRSVPTDRPRRGPYRYAPMGSAEQSKGPALPGIGSTRLGSAVSGLTELGARTAPPNEGAIQRWKKEIQQRGVVTAFYDHALITVYQKPGKLRPQQPWMLRWMNDWNEDFTLESIGLSALSRSLGLNLDQDARWEVSANLDLLFPLDSRLLVESEQETEQCLLTRRFGPALNSEQEWGWHSGKEPLGPAAHWSALARSTDEACPVLDEQSGATESTQGSMEGSMEGSTDAPVRKLSARAGPRGPSRHPENLVFACLYLSVGGPRGKEPHSERTRLRVAREWAEPLRSSHLSGHWVGRVAAELTQDLLLAQRRSALGAKKPGEEPLRSQQR